MKTIFITVSQGYLARTLFTSGIVDKILQEPSVKVVVFVPRTAYDFMVHEHSHERLMFEGYTDVAYSRLRKAFVFFSRYILINATSVNLAYYGSGKARQFGWLYASLFPLLFILDKVPYIRAGIQWLNRTLFPDTVFDHYFEKYKPEVVLVSNILAKVDVAFVKAAKRHQAVSVAMTKGWDNLDKYYLQVKADKLIVQIQPMVSYAQKYQGYEKKNILVSGFPAFDFYRPEHTTISRDEVCRKMGLDPARKILFFGSEGVWSSNDHEIVQKLVSWVNDDHTFSVPCSLIIRPHFGDIAHHRYKEFRNTPNVFVYDEMRTVEGFSDKWYSNATEMEYFVSVMRALDVLISVRSTLSLDAISCDKPVINLTKRAYIEASGKDSTMNLYKHIFYRDLICLGGILLAGDDAEIVAAVNRYVKDPKADGDKREKVRGYYGNLLSDASAAEKIATFVLGLR